MEDSKLSFKGSPTRCPYCHSQASSLESAVCQDCLARHHVACWDESGACASCSGDRRLEPAREPSDRAAPPRESSVPILFDEDLLDDGLIQGLLSFVLAPLLGLLLGFLLAFFINDQLSYLRDPVFEAIVASGFVLGLIASPFVLWRLRKRSARKWAASRG